MLSILLKNIKNISLIFLYLPIHSLHSNIQSYKLGTKKNNYNSETFKDIFNYTSTTVFNLFSLQKVNYVGLHAASAARWIKIRVSYALNS